MLSGWSLVDLKGICPSMCMHRILLEDGHKLSVEAQRRLKSTIKEVVRKEVLKWLDAGVIYPISDSSWVSPVQAVPKKGGTIVIRTKNNALLPSRIVTGWRICIDYQKDHFPLPFLDQMLDRLAGMSITVSWMGIRVIIRSLYHQMTKRKQNLRARMVRLLLGECPLGYVTHQARFNAALWPYS